MATSGYTSAKKAVKGRKRIIMSIQGREKEGKDHFALTAPGPIALMDLDMGLEGVIEKFWDEKEIEVASFNYRDATNLKQWEQMWEKMKSAYMAALQSKDIRTVIMDTGTEIWELLRLARFGKLSQVMPHHYGPVNAEFRDLIRKAYDADKNLLILHKMKDRYVNDKNTGEMERSGFKDMGYIVQVNIEVWRREDDGFGLTVLDCRQQPDLANMELTAPLNDFPTLAGMIYPNSEEGEWD